MDHVLHHLSEITIQSSSLFFEGWTEIHDSLATGQS